VDVLSAVVVLLAFSRLYIKGEESEDAVLCSKSATFGLQRAETSNTLLLANVTAASPGERKDDEDSERTRINVPIYSILGSHIEVSCRVRKYLQVKTLVSLPFRLCRCTPQHQG
jgi:hypothetical protein